MKLKWFFVPVMLSLLVSGCWDRRELDQLGIIFAVGIDKDQETKEYIVTLQIVRPSVLHPMGGGKQGDAIETFSVKGNTLLEAIKFSTRQFDRKPFFSHNKIVVINEDLAREGIVPLLDYFRRGNEPRELAWFFVAKGTTAKEILSGKMGIDPIQGSYLDKIIKTSKRENGKTSIVNTLDLSKKLLGSGIEPVLGAMEIFELESPEVKKQSKGVVIIHTAVFKQDKLVGFLNDFETRGLNWVTNEARGGAIIIPSLIQDNKLATIEIKNASGKIIPQIINGNIQFTIQVKEEGILDEIKSPGVEYKEKPTKKFLDYQTRLENEQRKVIEREIKKAIHKAQKLKSDIFGFGVALHHKYPKKWKEVESKWDKIFPEVKFTIKVEAHIRRTGLILEPIIPK